MHEGSSDLIPDPALDTRIWNIDRKTTGSETHIVCLPAQREPKPNTGCIVSNLWE